MADEGGTTETARLFPRYVDGVGTRSLCTVNLSSSKKTHTVYMSSSQPCTYWVDCADHSTRWRNEVFSPIGQRNQSVEVTR